MDPAFERLAALAFPWRAAYPEFGEMLDAVCPTLAPAATTDPKLAKSVLDVAEKLQPYWPDFLTLAIARRAVRVMVEYTCVGNGFHEAPHPTGPTPVYLRIEYKRNGERHSGFAKRCETCAQQIEGKAAAVLDFDEVVITRSARTTYHEATDCRSRGGSG